MCSRSRPTQIAFPRRSCASRYDRVAPSGRGHCHRRRRERNARWDTGRVWPQFARCLLAATTVVGWPKQPMTPSTTGDRTRLIRFRSPGPAAPHALTYPRRSRPTVQRPWLPALVPLPAGALPWQQPSRLPYLSWLRTLPANRRSAVILAVGRMLAPAEWTKVSGRRSACTTRSRVPPPDRDRSLGSLRGPSLFSQPPGLRGFAGRKGPSPNEAP